MNLKGEKVLVTGGKGFIGSSLASKLKEEGAKVIIYDIVDGHDVTDWNHVGNFSASKLVYHLAAILSIPYSWQDPKEFYRVNVLGTTNMLEYCRKHDSRLIFVSSYAYGVPDYMPIDENHPLKPNNAYAHSKYIAEEICHSYAKYFGVSCTILRPFNVYGGTQKGDLLIPTILRQIKTSSKIVLENPNPRRDWLYVGDAVRACILACKCNETQYEVFNIGYGKSYQVKEVVDLILEIYDKEIPVFYSNIERKNEIMNVVADIRKAKSKLGWEPKVSLKEGLKAIMREADLI